MQKRKSYFWWMIMSVLAMAAFTSATIVHAGTHKGRDTKKSAKHLKKSPHWSQRKDIIKQSQAASQSFDTQIAPQTRADLDALKILSTPKSLHESPNLSILASSSISSFTKQGGQLNTINSSDSHIGVGSSLVYAHPLNRTFIAEAGATYLTRNFGNGYQSRWLKLSPMVRLHPDPIFGLGLGGYYARHLTGEGPNREDFGASITGGVYPSLSKKLGLVFEYKHSRGLKDVDVDPKVNFRYVDSELLIGLRFGI